MIVMCPYCNTEAKLVDSKIVYHGRSYGMIWLCSNYPKCDAYVGVHRATDAPLGRMANAELRKAKMAAHNAFDPHWKKQGMSRNEAYGALALMMDMTIKQCHIGKFDVKNCNRVVEICKIGFLKGGD